ncbi:hypothetical protein AWB68_03428 [Caballeronia choica]|jgi:hypothetical protein|uniref:Uncharacterized protein n=1 Tax=Caballeronia choica TaxID=326476 RepID=A0A158J4C6_9BURK|nr:hypothetical protein [Caballeronia choica]SAL63666.1 hypothetical protein AWB68_03428 [Caballeronia choica]
MPHRYPILERIAFTLFTLSAVVDATYISYEKSPNFRDNIHEIVRIGEEMSRLYPQADVDPWMPIAIS